MSLQSTNRVKIGKCRETTFGVTPTNPVFQTLRQTSSSLAFNPQTVESNIINSDRQVQDLILVGQQAGGDIADEMAFQEMDADMEEALQGTWQSNPVITVVTSDTEISDLSATTATVAAGGAAFVASTLALLQGFPTAVNNKVAKVASSTATTIVFPASTFTAETVPIPVGASIRSIGFQGVAGDLSAVTAGGNGLTSTTLDLTTFGLVVGEWIKPAGFATAVDNDFCRISAIAAHKISFDRVPTGWVADTGAAVIISVYMGDVLVNGVTQRSNTIERQYLDHSPVTYEYFTGQSLDKFSVTADAQKVATYTKSYLGSNGSDTTTRVAGATDIPAVTNDVLNTSSNVGRIGFNGNNVTGPNYVLSVKFDIANNLRRQNAIGSLGAVGIGNGEFQVTGTLSTYFGDKSVLDLILSNARTSFDFRVGRQDGNKTTLVFDFPTIKMSSGSPAVSGKNADVMIDAGFQAIKDATLGYTMSIGRFWFIG